MHKTQNLALALLLLVGLCQRGDARDETQPPATIPPNIVLIYADDLGYADLGCYGSSLHRTPNLDQLATGGMLFTNAYANAPNCAPSRACLMSGQYGPRHGIYTVQGSARGKAENRKMVPPKNRTVLPDEIWTLPEMLREAGYVSAQIGKWHLGADPRTQGFDLNVAGNQAGHPKSYFSPYRNEQLPDGEAGEYLTDRLTDESIEFMETNRSRPFFLYLSHYAVHTPIQAKQDLKDFYAERNKGGNPGYAAMVDSLDQSVGRIIECLERLELRENTLVLFTSDNGGNGGVTSMAPLRGSKGMLYEGGIREPFIASWPGHIEAGVKEHSIVIGTDLFPTLAQLGRAKVPEDALLDGVDISGLLLGESALVPRELHWHFPAYLEAGGKRRQGSPWRTTPVAAIRQGRFKLIEFFEDGRLELYDLVEDISEEHNLAEKMPEKVTELHGLMAEWRKQTDAAMPSLIDK
ncbi:MAG: arylsulfatase A-like enzyme [Candidatus Paceibacteria bacterium]|jgi:arylsulfatase A-like enzyme